MNRQARKQVKLGELLVACSVVNREQIDNALLMAGRTKLPLGRILSAAGLVTPQELDWALELQRAMSAKGISIEFAATAFKQIKCDSVPFEEALMHAIGGDPELAPTKLGALLLDANLITAKQLEDARKTSTETSMPIGRVMCLMGLLEPQLLKILLDIQTKLRDKSITRIDAVEFLRQATKPLRTGVYPRHFQPHNQVETQPVVAKTPMMYCSVCPRYSINERPSSSKEKSRLIDVRFRRRSR